MRALVAAGLLVLAGCDTASRSAERDAGRKIADGEVALIAVAPDGTKLWGVSSPGSNRRVYFASSGTQQTTQCGKSCQRTDTVPTASPEVR